MSTDQRSGQVQSYHPAFRPLDSTRQEIRLLIVQPGVAKDIVECSFRYGIFSRSIKPLYETISYVWGDASLRSNVRLNGQEMDVPASSERVLRRFRYTSRERVLWIDALCINQADPEERSSQVALMDKIYSSTIRNLIWLGEGDETTATAVKCIQKLVDEMRAETNNIRTARELLYDENGLQLFASHGLSFAIATYEIESIERFYTSQWFQRLWIVQEAALANNNNCCYGQTECFLDTILRAARWISYKWLHVPYRRESTNNACYIWDFCDRRIGLYSSLQFRLSLLNVLADTADLSATEPRDHIFAVLGLASKFASAESHSRLLRPDYTKSIPTVFTDTAIYCIFQRQDLAILNFVRHR